MKKFKFIYIVVTLALMASCDRDEVLDIKPYGKVLPEKVEDFELLMNERASVGGTSVGRAPSYGTDLVLSDDIKITETPHLDLVNGDEERILDALTWNENFGKEDEIDVDWLTLYNQIQVMNTIFDQVNDPEITGEQSQRDVLIAEAKVHRAYAYYALINLYAKQYDASTASSDLGVPISLSSEFKHLSRASVQEVYDLIISDLSEALESGTLPETVTERNWRASDAAVYAVQAKVYLAMGEYTLALDAADKCLQQYNTLTDLNSIFFQPDAYDNEEVILLKSYAGSYQFLGDVLVSQDLLDSYAADDLRPAIRFQTVYDWSQGFPPIEAGKKFDVGQNFSERPHLALSVAEMLLIRAECNARPGGDFTKAIDDLNTLRVNRFRTGTYTDLTTSELPDAATTLAFVKEERRRELAGQGARWFDLKRYNAYDGDNISITRTVDGKTVTLEPNSNRWIVPISRRDITLSGGELVQSPR